MGPLSYHEILLTPLAVTNVGTIFLEEGLLGYFVLMEIAWAGLHQRGRTLMVTREALAV